MEPKNALMIALQITRSHHERINGSRYPDGLKGDEIPFFAKVVAVADSFDAMTTVRPYSNGLTFEEAIKELHRCKETHFDSKIVEAFTDVLKES